MAADPHIAPVHPLVRACYEGYYQMVKFLCLRGVKKDAEIEEQCLNVSRANVFINNWLIDTRGLDLTMLNTCLLRKLKTSLKMALTPEFRNPLNLSRLITS